MAVFSGNGAVGSPSFTFSSDTDTGFYRNADNKIGITCGGSNVALSTTSLWQTLATQHGFSDGTNAVPSISFTNDLDTGLYSSTANHIQFATGGSSNGNINADRLFYSYVNANHVGSSSAILRGNYFYTTASANYIYCTITDIGTQNGSVYQGAFGLFFAQKTPRAGGGSSNGFGFFDFRGLSSWSSFNYTTISGVDFGWTLDSSTSTSVVIKSGSTLGTNNARFLYLGAGKATWSIAP